MENTLLFIYLTLHPTGQIIPFTANSNEVSFIKKTNHGKVIDEKSKSLYL